MYSQELDGGKGCIVDFNNNVKEEFRLIEVLTHEHYHEINR